MNNTFNIERFGLLLKRKWLEFGKIYLVTLSVAFGVILLGYLIAFWRVFMGLSPVSSRNLVFREPLFMIFGFLFITAVASNYFAHLGQKSKTIIDLLIPASTFEKFVAGVFFTGVLTTISFTVLFCLTDLIFITKLRNISHSVETSSYTDAHGTVTVVKDNLAYFFAHNKINRFLPLYVFPFFFTSIFLLGSVYFNKFHYIKTALSVMVFAGIWTFIIVNTGEYLTRNRRHVGDSGSFFNNPGKDTIEWMLLLLLLVFTFIFWGIAYVRLKEKEV
ncbi:MULTISPECIES: hypothetical protein [Pedobacter]|uniref:Uncharacterized protein n=1 Tax=Pedobacter heparinus (strain ATCC 13125 / DSM 2366 / CIP 104194 / JCM 7457 / NBRC 12017 / NCIMB 9290 / NRRL B-14731 / HIM 762-3) TaxID=485917 RepID=C6XSI4_PEDHD|nr:MULTISPECIES: hypothetical protein [Pedobacter]ACU05547.1 hypothetical protein Phep_3353 [Pedobacter heparinus DSM 2366]MBB5440488.1 hypothetical protein [Pedobacter sp. AK017]